VKLGLHIADFTWPEGAPRLGATLADIASSADEAGFERISVMDHLWQIGVIGPPEHEMLEAYTALGFLAAHTKAAKLLTLVTGVVYRDPGLLAKAVTTLDVLSGGRAILGIGAAWNEEESRGLGLLFPPTAERFERLEEALQICLQMFHGDEKAYDGKHYKLGRPLNSPAPLSRPHPPILIGGGGEKKTLLLVAKYADACNLFPGPDVQRKLDVLKQHCETVGRDYDEIEKTVLFNFDLGEKGERVREIIEGLRQAAALGFTVAHGGLRHAWDTSQFEYFKNEIVPAAEAL
jgi:F420-dependent oxidoreductase-like protein